MGARIPDEKPELPLSVVYIWELHRSIRFSLIPDDNDNYSLMPRNPINSMEVESYTRQAGLDLSRLEFDAILAIDAIFEKYRG